MIPAQLELHECCSMALAWEIFRKQYSMCTNAQMLTGASSMMCGSAGLRVTMRPV